MERISDTITSVFRIAIKNNRPALCSEDGVPVWGDTFGLGWRLGLVYSPEAKLSGRVHLRLDHNHTQVEQDQATVTVCLKDTAGRGANGFKEKVTTISDFGHGGIARLGSWKPKELALHPYVSLTITTKARLPQPATIPLPSTSQALRQSLESGEFVDTKFHVFSAKRSGILASRPRVVYANSDSIGLVPPQSMGGKQENGSKLLVNMTSDHHMNEDSVLHEYEYEQDSDLDEEEDSNDTTPQRNTFQGNSQMAGSSLNLHTPTSPIYDGPEGEFPAELPPYSVSKCRMILVKGVAYKTWLSYVHFRYTGQVAFRPLTSAQGSSSTRPDDSDQLPPCSPKSMYRLATILGDEKMKELASHAIFQWLSKDNIIEEAFTWFTSKYAAISEYEVERVIELRKSPEVSSALKCQIDVVSNGEKPWAKDVLFAIVDKLNRSEPSN